MIIRLTALNFTVPAVCAKLAFRDSDCFFSTLKSLEFKGSKLQAAAYLISESAASFCIGADIFGNIFYSLFALKFVDYLTCDKLQF